MDKEFILNEIKRTAAENDGKPLGRDRFFKHTGIKESDWFGKYWARWSDAIIEAGFTPNIFQSGYDENLLLKKFTDFTRELGKFPTTGELRIEGRNNPNFPSGDIFKRRFGNKSQLAKRIVVWCEEHKNMNDIVELCLPHCQDSDETRKFVNTEEDKFGFVYLMKSGRYYKIGRSSAPGRREYEIGIQLPEELKTIHTIKTDDPVGIEEYWHKRFNAKRKKGEWFDLSSADVKAFKRRKFM
ncbi:GIY-YIG nuclease family protein [bacterium]|nr:GIY-YIG nuclease family protein [bacterium]